MAPENKFLIIVLVLLSLLLLMLLVPFLPCNRYELNRVFVILKPPAHSHYTTKEVCVERSLPFL